MRKRWNWTKSRQEDDILLSPQEDRTILPFEVAAAAESLNLSGTYGLGLIANYKDRKDYPKRRS